MMPPTAVTPQATPNRRLRDGALIAAILLIGGLGSGLGWRVLSHAEQLRAEELRNAAVQSVLASFELELARTVEAVRNAGLMVELQPQLQRAGFSAYAARLTQQLPSISILEWQPLVPAQHLAQFESEARAQGLTDFRVREPDEKTGDWTAAPARQDYLPVLYAWPEENAPLGFNLGADKLRMASKLEAKAIKQPVASESFRILRGDILNSKDFGFAITTPVFDLSKADGDEPRLRGYLAAVVELAALFRTAAERADAAHLGLRIYDLAKLDSGPIFSTPDAAESRNAPSAREARRQLEQIRFIDVAHRQWRIELRPRPSFYAALPSSYAATALAAGLGATLALMLLSLNMQQARRKVELAQRSLREERGRLQNIIEATGAGTWEYGFDTGQLRVNPRWSAITGQPELDSQALRSYRWEDHCHPDDLAAASEALRRHLGGASEGFDAEYRIRKADGQWLWVQARGKVLSRSSQGRALSITGTLLEIDARKKAEAALFELNSTLEQRVQERGAELESARQKLQQFQEELFKSEARATLNTLAASVSHELSTPLSNSLISASTLVAQAREFEAKTKAGGLHRSDLANFLAQVKENSALGLRNLERAVELMGSFRQVATDQGSEQRRSFDLRAMIQELIDTLAPSLRLAPHTIKVDVAAGITLDSYPGQLGQVLINLINNAYLHAFDAEHPGELIISASSQGNSVLISCRDNGQGMTQATQEKMFVPFFSTKLGKGGNGLGMTIVDNLIRKLMGGSIQLESHLGQGTSVYITLPLTAPTAPPP